MFIKLSKASTVLLISTAAVVALSACSTPNWVPTGYGYHDEVYKSPNPPASPKFTAAQRATMGPEQAEQFRQSIYSLVESLTARAGQAPKPMFILKPQPMTSFYANLDNDLRESLRHLNYTLADYPEGAYVMTYEASLLSSKPDQPAAPGAPNVHIALRIFDGIGDASKMLTIEEGDFYIQGAEKLNVPFASFPGVTIPEPTGPGEFNR